MLSEFNRFLNFFFYYFFLFLDISNVYRWWKFLLFIATKITDLLLQNLLLGRTTNVNYRTAIARQKRKVGIEYNWKYFSMIPGPYSADLRWPVLWFVHIFYNSVGKASFFIDICESTLERYISKFLVIGRVKPGQLAVCTAVSVLRHAKNSSFLHTKYGNHRSFRSCNLRSVTTAISRSV